MLTASLGRSIATGLPLVGVFDHWFVCAARHPTERPPPNHEASNEEQRTEQRYPCHDDYPQRDLQQGQRDAAKRG